MKVKTTRIDLRFNDELEDIKEKRLERRIDKKGISIGKITSLIPRHKRWGKMKEDIIEYIFQKEVNFVGKE